MLAQELNKPVIKKFKRRKLYVRIKDNIWEANLPEISPSPMNPGDKYLCHKCFHQLCLG